MSPEQTRRQEHPLLVTEYEEIAENIRHCVTILWEAFKTFFTVISLFFGGYYYVTTMDTPGIIAHVGRYALPTVGMLSSLVGALAIRRIVEHEELLLQRGAAIEQALQHEGQMRLAHDKFKRGISHLDYLSYAVFFVFGLAWALLLLSSFLSAGRS